jgi:thiol-disulfide isomerase/thioredoxin
MRRIRISLASGALILALSSIAAAQDPFQKAGQGNTQSTDKVVANQQSAQTDSFPQPEQPMPLGDLARLVRAKKNSQTKAVKVFDDDNMPRAPHRGDAAPEFGGSKGSSQKPVLLDFWATWCGVCRDALPGLKRLRSVYGSDKLEVISVSEDEDEDGWREFVHSNRMTWEQRLDTNHELMRKFGASALPTYVLIGRDGKIVQQWVGDDPDQPLVDRMGPDLQRALAGTS